MTLLQLPFQELIYQVIYAGTDSITFTIDSSAPTLVSFTDNDSNNYVNQYTNITLSATFSEAMANTPTVSISGLVTNTAMTVSASTNLTTWTYLGMFLQVMMVL